MAMAMPRMPSSSGVGPERSGAGGLGTVGNGSLHAVEKEQAAEQHGSDGGGRSLPELRINQIRNLHLVWGRNLGSPWSQMVSKHPYIFGPSRTGEFVCLSI